MILKGRAWRLGDDVKAGGGIISTKYDNLRHVGDRGASHALEDIDPEFAVKVRKGDIIFAGRGFGWGHGHYHLQAARVLMNSGIAAVIAESFGAGFDRKAINACGFPTLVYKGLPKLVDAGDEIEFNLASGSFQNLTRGLSTQVPPVPLMLREILESGGLDNYTLRRLGKLDESRSREARNV